MLQVGSGVVTRSRCLGAWSIPGATEVLNVIIMARKQAVKTCCTPHPLALCLLQDLGQSLPTSTQAKGSQPGGGVLAAAMPGTPRIRGAVKKGEEKGSIGELGLGVVQSQQHYEMIFPCMGLIWRPPCPGFPFSWVPSSLGGLLSSFLLHPAPPSKDVPERLGTTTGACWHQAGHGALLSPLCWQDAAQFDLG